MTASDRGDVDHFRPKSIYWWLAYDFGNYLLSCSRCNRIRKGARFPLAADEKGLRFGDGRREHEEKKLLVDPSRDDVECIGLERRNGVWFLAARVVDGRPDSQAEETIRFFELNLGVLMAERQRAIASALEEAERVRSGKGSLLQLQISASRYHPFGYLISRVLAECGYGDLLPSPRDEVRLALSEVILDLESYDEALARSPNQADTRNVREAALWAVVVLWWAPPPSTERTDIEKWIDDPYREEARALVKQLEGELAAG